MAQIRQATIEDAFGIASVHVRTWQVAYRGHMPDAFLDSLDVEKRATMWRELAKHQDKIIFIAEDANGEIIGFSALGPSRDPDAAPRTAEVSAIYVDPNHWKHGIGRALMAASLGEIRKRDFDQLTLWVLEGNRRAQSFYQTFGFIQDGPPRDDDHWKNFVVREVRYRLDLRAT